jgi:hypothetical protein
VPHAGLNILLRWRYSMNFSLLTGDGSLCLGRIKAKAFYFGYDPERKEVNFIGLHKAT